MTEPTSSGETVTAFSDRFLRTFADAMRLPYQEFAAAYSDLDRYGDPRMAKAKALIYRAAAAEALMLRGWRRKLKRAKRIQRDVFGSHASNVWFEMQWLRACREAQRTYRWYAWQERIYEALMADKAIVARPMLRRPRFNLEELVAQQRIVVCRRIDDRFYETLSEETLVDGKWKKLPRD